ncbi:MAG: hypothetical protein L0Y42_07940, partial [Phycisphaerales bacterium]|nr:hypothetical protein [Phycisphaerales bacterium]
MSDQKRLGWLRTIAIHGFVLATSFSVHDATACPPDSAAPNESDAEFQRLKDDWQDLLASIRESVDLDSGWLTDEANVMLRRLQNELEQ